MSAGAEPSAGLDALDGAGGPAPILLDGSRLTVGEVARVARQGARVDIAEGALARVAAARRAVLAFAENAKPVYGLNTGLGLNKDRRVPLEAVETYNRNVIRSHATGVGPNADESEVRATLLVRLNRLLLGHSGAQPAVAELHREFLNRGIHPVMPSRGSVGQCDIAILAHIGLALIGEGDVRHGGRRMPARAAMALHGLEPVAPGVKDGLAIVSSNAYSAALACLLLDELADLLLVADAVCALTVEAIQGNLDPLDPVHGAIHPVPGVVAVQQRMRDFLRGSALWREGRAAPLQDPLSVRCAAQVHGAVQDGWRNALGLLRVHLNAADDNPAFLPDAGRFVGTGNTSVCALALAFEALGLALNHLARACSFRTHGLGNPALTGLTRFLTPDPDGVIGFAVLQKTMMALDAEIRHLANPVSCDYHPLAGHMEDQATNAPYVMIKTRRMVDILWTMLAIEAIHGAQAVDLRGGPAGLGAAPAALYAHLRALVPRLDRDRPLGAEAMALAAHLRSRALIDGLDPLDPSGLRAMLA